MPMTSDDNVSGEPQPKSRLDREIEEILAREERPRPLPPPIPIRRNVPILSRNIALPPSLRAISRIPITQALALALLAWIVDDFSPFLANVLAMGAVVCIILPIARKFRPPAPSQTSEIRMWRGQIIESRKTSPHTPLDTLRDWWNAHRR